MTKKECLAILPQKKAEGYFIAPTLILDIFQDDDEVPESFFEMIYYIPKPAQPIILYGTQNHFDALDNALKKYIEKS